MVRIGVALAQCSRLRPHAAKLPCSSGSTVVFGNSGSCGLNSRSRISNVTHSATIATTSSPTGKKKVSIALLNFVFISRVLEHVAPLDRNMPELEPYDGG